MSRILVLISVLFVALPGVVCASTTYTYNITATGDLYVDYSVFGGNLGTHGGNFSFNAAALAILPSTSESPDPADLSTLQIFTTLSPSMDITGSALLFSSTPLTNVSFVAGRNITLGDYEALRPVPLPDGWSLLAAGLAAVSLVLFQVGRRRPSGVTQVAAVA